MGLLDRLEAGIERAVQGTFARHLRSAVHPVEIASNIRRAMDDRAVTSSGRAIVPNVFVIELSPSDFDRLSPDLAGVEEDLVAAAEEHCDGQHYQPAGPFDMVFEEHDDLETGVFRLRPSKASRPRATGLTGQERAVAPRPSPVPAEAAAGALAGAGGAAAPDEDDDGPTRPHEQQAPPPARPRRVNPADRPWLDVDGERYPLMGAMTILGRDDSADIILDDPGHLAAAQRAAGHHRRPPLRLDGA